ncbi:MAG: M48 family metalloprotease [Planctomycetes bacterium]|nr:M48 family metalloprotease [Planctomycetota bacterium]
MISCPRCREPLVETLTKRSVLMDVCAECEGIWLDAGEPLHFSRDRAKTAALLEQSLIDEKPSPLTCPRCGGSCVLGGLGARDLKVDRCTRCRGMWFDQGELDRLAQLDLQGIDPRRRKEWRAPRVPALRGTGRNQPAAPAIPERPPQGREPASSSPAASGGTHFLEIDPSALPPSPTAAVPMATLAEPGPGKPPVTFAPVAAPAAVLRGPFRGSLPALPSLGMRTGFVFVALYGMVGFVFILLAEVLKIGWAIGAVVSLGFIFLNYLLSPWIMDWTLRWVYSLDWVTPAQLPDRLRAFIAATCARHRIPVPRIGIIRDGTPNAFTYGHIPSDARLVFTRGLIDLLDEEELDAVAAHELGHAIHWDILVMTMASTVPILLYSLYRFCMESSRRVRRSSSGKKGGNPLPLVGLVAYLLYIVAEYVVLYLSRVRELWADRFSGTETGNPNALQRALVKIAYGLASSAPAEREDGSRKAEVQAVRSLGIFDPVSARGLAMASVAAGGTTIDPANAVSAMQWDLWNPWGMYYELHSTHPLPAHRLQALGAQARAMGLAPQIEFNAKQPESYWDEFFVDVAVASAPLVAFLLGLALAFSMGLGPQPHWERGIAGGVCLLGIGSLISTLFSYRGGDYPLYSIAGLLKKIKVSRVRPVPCTLRGKIIGRGVPGLIWSSDLVMQDATGFILLDYRQPLGLLEWLFGLLRAGSWIGEEVTVTGWYRRGPTPYLELKSLTNASGGTSRCYVYLMKLIVEGMMIVGGLAAMAVL